MAQQLTIKLPLWRLYIPSRGIYVHGSVCYSRQQTEQLRRDRARNGVGFTDERVTRAVAQAFVLNDSTTIQIAVDHR